MAYPGYGAPGAGYGGYPQTDPLFGYFSAVAGQDQQIDPKELQGCLTSSGISGTYQPFNLETCRIMIAMLDRDYSGRMGFNEFKELWAALNQWKTTFMQYDRDRSGTVEPNELATAMAAFGYRLSPQALNMIVKRYSVNGRISFDDFVACAVRLRLLTDQFRRRDTMQTGHANFAYDDKSARRTGAIHVTIDCRGQMFHEAGVIVTRKQDRGASMLRRMYIRELNPYILCVLCGGYLVDATTIVECLHSFCRSCIVKYLQTSRQCPVCDTEVHKTRPLLHIRPDRTLQDVVNKLVPGLYFGEVQRRKAFDEDQQRNLSLLGESLSLVNEAVSSAPETNDSRYAPVEDAVCITLEYFRLKKKWDNSQVFPTRYLRCPSAVTVGVLKKFLVMKFAIPDTHKVELIRCDEIIDDHLTLKEVIEIYGLYTKRFLDLQYVFLEVSTTEEMEVKSEEPTSKQQDEKENSMRPEGNTAPRPASTAPSDEPPGGRAGSPYFEPKDLPSLPETPSNFELSPCSREIQPMA